MAVAPPPSVPSGVLQRVRADMRTQRAARGGWPPGEMSFSPGRTREFEREPLPLLLRMRERHGPVFTIRLLYQPVVFALGPEANHYMTVSHASNFRWRDGGMGDLIPLLGDGLLTTDRELRDQVMTLLFAGHDTATSTVTFMFYELARNPQETDPLALLDMMLDETLRMYPPAWIGPRRSIDPFELHGVNVPGGVMVNYCSWASHHLPEVFPEPWRFLPSRFAPNAKAALPKGAYVPFGGGSRTCIGMRFGQVEIKAIARAILSRFSLELAEPGRRMSIRQMPTLSPGAIFRDRSSISLVNARLFWKSLVVQAIVVAVPFVLLGFALDESFFEDWGWLAGPVTWLACAAVTARILSMPAGYVLFSAVAGGVAGAIGVLG